MRYLVMIGLGGVALTAAACATVPPPTEKLAETQAAIRGATELGASGSPQAALHLRLANEQVDSARALMDDGENERAAFLLQRAESDAQLALALARESRERTEAQQAVNRAHSLEQEVRTTK